MQEVWGSNPRLGGLRVGPLRVSEGIGILQSRAPGLQSTTQDIPSGPKRLPRIKQKQYSVACLLCISDASESEQHTRDRGCAVDSVTKTEIDGSDINSHDEVKRGDARRPCALHMKVMASKFDHWPGKGDPQKGNTPTNHYISVAYK